MGTNRPDKAKGFGTPGQRMSPRRGVTKPPPQTPCCPCPLLAHFSPSFPPSPFFEPFSISPFSLSTPPPHPGLCCPLAAERRLCIALGAPPPPRSHAHI